MTNFRVVCEELLETLRRYHREYTKQELSLFVFPEGEGFSVNIGKGLRIFSFALDVDGSFFKEAERRGEINEALMYLAFSLGAAIQEVYRQSE